jgi:hypothetical protein
MNIRNETKRNDGREEVQVARKRMDRLLVEFSHRVG